MALSISDEFLEASQLTPTEFLQEIALYLFQTGRLTVSYAAKMAQMERGEFEDLLKARQIPLYHSNVEDATPDNQLKDELANLAGTWTNTDELEFLENTKPFREIHS